MKTLFISVLATLALALAVEAVPVNSRASAAKQNATNAAFESRLVNLEAAAPTNAVAVSTTVFQASNAVHSAAAASLLATNNAQDATIATKAGTNVLGGITFRIVDGTNLLAIVGTSTNQVFLAPYTPPE
jgi:hypothetical protein